MMPWWGTLLIFVASTVINAVVMYGTSRYASGQFTERVATLRRDHDGLRKDVDKLESENNESHRKLHEKQNKHGEDIASLNTKVFGRAAGAAGHD